MDFVCDSQKTNNEIISVHEIPDRFQKAKMSYFDFINKLPGLVYAYICFFLLLIEYFS